MIFGCAQATKRTAALIYSQPGEVQNKCKKSAAQRPRAERLFPIGKGNTLLAAAVCEAQGVQPQGVQPHVRLLKTHRAFCDHQVRTEGINRSPASPRGCMYNTCGHVDLAQRTPFGKNGRRISFCRTHQQRMVSNGETNVSRTKNRCLSRRSLMSVTCSVSAKLQTP